MEQTQLWAASVARAVGERVAYHRARAVDAQGRKLTTQALADRTVELGYPMDRSVIAKLEKGHRLTITVPDILVLAAALEITPLRLLLPLGQADTVEILPHKMAATTDAMHWIRGDGSMLDGFEDDDPVVSSFVAHAIEVSRWSWAVELAASIRAGEIAGNAEHYDSEIARARLNLKNYRAALRDRGLTPPPLPPELRLEDGRP